MHDILEGALQYEIKLMLLMMIQDEGFFSLDVFNSRLMTTELGYMEVKDRPSSISHATLTSLGHSLKQNGMSVLYLEYALVRIFFKIYSSTNVAFWSNSPTHYW